MRIEQARPDPEKAAKTQELHRRLRVCLSILVWVVELKEKNKKKKLFQQKLLQLCIHAYCTLYAAWKKHNFVIWKITRKVIAHDRVFPCSLRSVRSSQSLWL